MQTETIRFRLSPASCRTFAIASPKSVVFGSLRCAVAAIPGGASGNFASPRRPAGDSASLRRETSFPACSPAGLSGILPDSANSASPRRPAGDSASQKLNPAKVRLIMYMAKQLGLTEDERRYFYQGVTGREHLTQMTPGQVNLVITQLKRQEEIKKNKTYQGVAMAQTAQSRKIRSLWLHLRDLGVLHDPSEKGLLAFARTHTGIGNLDTLTREYTHQAAKLIEQLKYWKARVEEGLVRAQALLEGHKGPFIDTETKYRYLTAAVKRLGLPATVLTYDD
jgi:hypothetical protein